MVFDSITLKYNSLECERQRKGRETVDRIVLHWTEFDSSGEAIHHTTSFTIEDAQKMYVTLGKRLRHVHALTSQGRCR
jgi:hypothetical protein